MKNNWSKLLVIALLIMAAVFWYASDTVISKGKDASAEQAAYYHHLENQYVKEARDILNRNGYANSGITMTYTVDEDGLRVYVVKMHHARLVGADKEKIMEVYHALNTICFEDGEVLYEII